MQSKTEIKAKEIQYPVHEDFFTKFIDKRKKHYSQKLEEISVLEKTDESLLKPDQKEKILSKKATIDRVKYFDDIKSLYFEAYTKKAKVNTAVTQSESSDKESVIGDVLNLLSAGCILSEFENGQKHEQVNLSGDQKTIVSSVYKSITNKELIPSVEETEAKLKAYAKNEEFKRDVSVFISNYKSSTKSAIANTLKTTNDQVSAMPKKEEIALPIPSIAKSKLFDYDSEEMEEENEQEVSAKKEIGQNVTLAESTSEMNNALPVEFLKPLPESDDRQHDDFRKEVPRRNGNRAHRFTQEGKGNKREAVNNVRDGKVNVHEMRNAKGDNIDQKRHFERREDGFRRNKDNRQREYENRGQERKKETGERKYNFIAEYKPKEDVKG